MFSSLSNVVRAFFALWVLLLCLFNMANGLFALGRKKYIFSALAVLLVAPLYFMWQVIFEYSLIQKIGEVVSIVYTLCEIAWYWWFICLLVFTGLTGLFLAYNIRCEKLYITPGSIKIFLDKVPCGVCCWKDNGRVLFTNICMNDLCVDITGVPLLNGNQFRDSIQDGIMTVNGKMWRFSQKDTMLGSESIHEMIASDITTEYAKTQALTKDKAELDRINKELREYALSIDDAVRHQEILQAKVNIHDEMNRLMLSTMAAESDDIEGLDKILSLWSQNALLLCMEADETTDVKAIIRIKELAKALKIQLEMQDNIIDELKEEERSIFYSAAQEAIANASKHAKASKMVINKVNTEKGIRCDFINNGTVPQGIVLFTGGLKNLERLASKIGAEVEVNSDNEFILSLTFKRNNSQVDDV